MVNNRYLVLLRGINVGGRNIIRMTDLKSCFESMGFYDVQTYIQSGNVLITSTETNVNKLTESIESTMSHQFDYESRIVLISAEKLRNAVTQAPGGFGKQPELYRYDVIFMKDNLIPSEVVKKVRTRVGVDQIVAGDTVLYFSRLTSMASKSLLPKIITMPEYQFFTVRNWNTTTRLLEMMES